MGYHKEKGRGYRITADGAARKVDERKMEDGEERKRRKEEKRRGRKSTTGRSERKSNQEAGAKTASARVETGRV